LLTNPQYGFPTRLPDGKYRGDPSQLRKNNPSDINNDGLINIFDLVAIASQFGQSGENLDGDVNGDGTVNIFDLILVAAHFGE